MTDPAPIVVERRDAPTQAEMIDEMWVAHTRRRWWGEARLAFVVALGAIGGLVLLSSWLRGV